MSPHFPAGRIDLPIVHSRRPVGQVAGADEPSGAVAVVLQLLFQSQYGAAPPYRGSHINFLAMGKQFFQSGVRLVGGKDGVFPKPCSHLNPCFLDLDKRILVEAGRVAEKDQVIVPGQLIRAGILVVQQADHPLPERPRQVAPDGVHPAAGAKLFQVVQVPGTDAA